MEILRMNCGNAFQILLYLDNRMTNRASYIDAQRRIIEQKKSMPFLCKACWIFHCIDQPHMPESYPVNQSGKNPRFQPGSWRLCGN